MSEIRVENLCHVFSAGTPFEKNAITNIDLTIPNGQLICVIGHTGSGKSTFLQHLNALLQPTSGKILFNGEDINKDKVSRRDIKYKVGLVFQYPEYQLFEETVYKDIAFGPKNMKLSDSELDERVREAAGFTGVDVELFDKSPLELSGGQKRRIAIAGVIAMRPQVLILDEPTAGLDPAGCEFILDNITNYQRKTGSTVIVVSHSMDDAARLADRIIVFNNGSVVMDGAPDEVFSRSEELREMGLSIPHSTAIALELKSLGIELQGAIYSHKQLVSAILTYKEAHSC